MENYGFDPSRSGQGGKVGLLNITTVLQVKILLGKDCDTFNYLCN
jgi:hypothetical protein